MAGCHHQVVADFRMTAMAQKATAAPGAALNREYRSAVPRDSPAFTLA